MPFDQPMLHWTTHAHAYQQRGAAHLYASTCAALWLSPGYGKSTITLHAFKALKDAGMAKNMLVIAPLRVIQTVWAQEVENWASLHGLRTARLHGPKKDGQLRRRDVDIWLINYEGIPWLAGLAKAKNLPFGFDVVVADEIRRFKNSQGMRFKAARPFFKLAKYRWGLTGTPASNGLEDLFGQFLMLDDGKALGDRITRFRRDYFEQGYDGFTLLPRPGAREAIEDRVAPYVFRADGKLELPDFVYDNRTVVLDDKARKLYTRLKQEMIAEVDPGTTLTAANAAVLMGKLKQLANGRVYDENHKVIEVHTAKADALRELVEELGDEQLLIAYEYNHDLAQIREILGDDIPYLGGGVTEKTAMSHIDRWNNREIQYLAAHPASAGHGLNLQKGGAHHILWWGPTFDLDHYIQFNDRLRRQGNLADAVIVHTFVTEKSVDETAVKARTEKATLQDALLSALTAEFGENTVVNTQTQESPVSDQQPLQFRSDAQQGQNTQFGGGYPQPQGGQQQTPQGNQQPQNNPFGGGQQQPQGNPYGGQQPAQQGQPQQNPFGGQQQAPQGNPFGGGQQQPQGGQQQAPQGNPFGGQQQPQGGVNLHDQQQQIRQDVGSAPPPTPNQAFAAYGVATGAQNPMGGQQQNPAQGQFGGQQQAPQHHDTGWQKPQQPVEEAQVVQDAAPTQTMGQTAAAAADAAPAHGMVPVFVTVPADKLVLVLRAIANAVK